MYDCCTLGTQHCLSSPHQAHLSDPAITGMGLRMGKFLVCASQVLDPEWFRGADVLDIGCNEGLLTLALAVGFGTRSMLGVDIDPGLVAKACTNLSRSRTQLTQQFRGAVASRWVCVVPCVTWALLHAVQHSQAFC